MRTSRAIALLLLVSPLTACRSAAVREEPRASATGPEGMIAATARAHGAVALLAQADLSLVRREVSDRGAPDAPMTVVRAADGTFLAGNFQGGLARIDPQGATEAIDLGGALSGLSISPDGARLAASGARDRTLRIVDLATFRETARVRFGDPAPAHGLTHGLVSTHPLWLDDRLVIAQDGIAPELVLIDAKAGAVAARVRVPGPVHQVLHAGGRVVALVEDPARVLVHALHGDALVPERSIDVPLDANEPARLHHGLVTPGEGVVVVANMGPLHGRPGTTVAAIDLGDGTVLWKVRGPEGAGHVVSLGDDRLLVAGHRSPELHVLEVTSGRLLGTWRLPDGVWPGHSVGVENGTALVLDPQGGRVLRVGPQGVIAQSPSLGGDVNEASFGE